MSSVSSPVRTAPRSRAWPRRRVVVGGLGLVVLVFVALAGALVVVRYRPALDEARALRTQLETMVERVQAAGLEIDRAALASLDEDLVAARVRLAGLRSLLSGDPLIRVARALPLTAANVQAADRLADGADSLLDAVGTGLAMGRQFVAVRDAVDGTGDVTLARLVGLMVETRDEAVVAAASVADTRTALAAIPDGVAAPLAEARDAVLGRIDRYAPMLEGYVDVSERLPAILGWDGPRRYLILTQDPAELRPTGGFVGTYAILSFERGRVTSFVVRDTGPLDYPWDYPWIDPPQDLADYLLGPDQPWQFADANWSPHFPTSARDVLRLYANQSGDDDLDGVIAITTFTIDELLRLTGPVTVPEFEATVNAGETTRQVLERTRTGRTPDEHPKAFLFAFADRLLDALLDLPPRGWARAVDTMTTLERQRHLLAWFVDDADQALVAGGPFEGAVRNDPGDVVYAVDANVAPVSKLNIVTRRSMDLTVELDAVGNARNTLTVRWDNDLDTPDGAWLRELGDAAGRTLGLYVRVFVPERSRVESVTGGGAAPLTNPAFLGQEAGRAVIGAYVRVPPGRTELVIRWISPYAADTGSAGGAYRLVVQKQPGLLPAPLTIRIVVPGGYRISAASEGLAVDGATATSTVDFDGDLVVGLRYDRP